MRPTGGHRCGYCRVSTRDMRYFGGCFSRATTRPALTAALTQWGQRAVWKCDVLGTAMYYIDSGEFFFSRRVEVGCWNSLDQEMVNASTVSMPSWRNYYGYKKAQLMLAYPRDAKTMKKNSSISKL